MDQLCVFVSYSREDRLLAERLVHVLSEIGLDPTWDDDIRPGVAFSDGIKELISQAHIFMPILTAKSHTSSWMNQEIGYATATGAFILAIAFKGVPANVTSQLQAIMVREDLSDLAERLQQANLEKWVRASTSSPALGRDRSIHAKAGLTVFISAKTSDYEFAREVYQFLESRGVPTFLSQETLPELGNSDYRKEIDRALDGAAHMVVVTSSLENVMSQWVEAEWGFFINEKRSGRKTGNLITVVVGDMQSGSLPPSLRYYEVIPFQPDQFEKVLRYVSR